MTSYHFPCSLFTTKPTSITTSSPWAGWNVYGEQGNKRPQVLYRSVSRKLKTHQILLIIKQLANQWRRKDVYLSCCLTKLNIEGNMMIKGHSLSTHHMSETGTSLFWKKVLEYSYLTMLCSFLLKRKWISYMYTYIPSFLDLLPI